MSDGDGAGAAPARQPPCATWGDLGLGLGAEQTGRDMALVAPVAPEQRTLHVTRDKMPLGTWRAARGRNVAWPRGCPQRS